jgi:hemerythrin-like domain-containing protein
MPIKRHKALQPLSRDHHQGLILAQILKKGAPEYKGMPSTIEGKKEYAIAFSESELKQHFMMEENVLFAYAVNKNEELDTLIKELLIEHREIIYLIEKITSSSQPENLLDEFGRKLESHIRKEEREVFVKVEEALSENELQELASKLKENPAKC